jgi:hypothetical protein
MPGYPRCRLLSRRCGWRTLRRCCSRYRTEPIDAPNDRVLLIASGVIVTLLATISGTGRDPLSLLRLAGVATLGANAMDNLPAYLAVELSWARYALLGLVAAPVTVTLATLGLALAQR